jgi:hypothetical protein
MKNIDKGIPLPENSVGRKCRTCGISIPDKVISATCSSCRDRTWEEGKVKNGLDPEKIRLGILPNNYNRARMQDLRSREERKCAICGISEIEHRVRFGKNLSVDHDHDTGLIRDLLCSKHNTGLGLLDDSIETLSRAIQYLQRHKKAP